MMAFTHVAAGCTAALLAADYLHAGQIQTALIVAGGILGAYLPDIDHPKSAFGSRVLPLSIPISAVFGHRGITHSLIAVVGVSWLMWWALHQSHFEQGFATPLVAGIAAGYLSHLVGDFFTNSGIPLLYPIRRRFVSPLKLCTGDAREYVLAVLMYGWSAFKCFKVFI
ncbi:MAG: metal-dependent hydrolase [Gallionella sp.]